MTENPFPFLPDDWESTRQTLHAYTKALCALPQSHLPHHPAWWHTSLKLGADGLRTENIPLPSGGIVQARFDLVRHQIVIADSFGTRFSFDFRENRTGTEMAEALIGAAENLGLAGNYEKKNFENDQPVHYRPEHVMPFWTALTNSAAVFEEHRASLDYRRVGPVQFWSHGFDLAFEWFGSGEAEAEGKMHPTQLNLGFYPHDPAYFYSNPFPFDADRLTGQPLEVGQWHTEMFSGTILYYDQVSDRPDGKDLLLKYATSVHKVAAPTLE